jgi:hypothetical protein
MVLMQGFKFIKMMVKQRTKDTQLPLKLPEQEYEAEIFFATVDHPCEKPSKSISQRLYNKLYDIIM